MSASDVTAAVTRIWTEVLRLPSAGTPGTFFDLSGDSITAVRLVGRIEDELGADLDVADIFEEDPDLHGLIGLVAARAETTAA